MNIFKHQTIESLVIHLLTAGEKSTSLLLDEVKNIRKVTKQGFYRAIRNLKRDEVILVYKKIVSLDPVWMNKMKDMLANMTTAYALGQNSFDVLGLEDKENVIYSFSTIKNLDAFWGHLQGILMSNTNEKEPIYSYDPHYWFYIARREREKELLEQIVQNKRQFLMTVGGQTPLDKIIKADFNNNYLQYNQNQMFDRINYYVTLIGDYIIEVYLDDMVSKRINDIYQSAPALYESVVSNLKKLLDSRTKNRIRVSRNKSKAAKLKKKFGKNFYILR